MNAEIISTLLMIVGGVTILTNIIIQVIKAHGTRSPTNLVALFVAEALTRPQEKPTPQSMAWLLPGTWWWPP